MPLSAAPSSAGFYSPLLPHSSLSLLSSPSSARGPVDTKPIRRNPMPHEDGLNHSQDQPSNPHTAALTGTSPAGKHSRLLWFLIIPLMLCAFGLFTWLSKSRTQKALAASTNASVAEPVSVLHPKTDDLTDEIVLPATLHAFSESPIYARTNGYISHWYADIGTHLTNCNVLPQIASSAPE